VIRSERVSLVMFSLLLALSASAGPLIQEDEGKIKREVWEPVVKTMPTGYAGTVYLDGQPLPGAVVSDGIGFVETGSDGRYKIDVKFDAMTPYLPARVIFVNWPEGTWPVKDKVSGRLLFWKRVQDVQDKPESVDFHLETRVIDPPFVVAFGADDHGNLWDNPGYVMAQEIERGGNRVHLGMHLGDITYATLEGAPDVFPHYEKYARDFPVDFIHVMGNHDIPGPFFGAHELGGNGAFHKWLAPVRFAFDAAGVHVVVFNYWLVNQQAVDWLDAELASVPPEKPVYLFTHMWGTYLGAICRKYPNIRLVMSGHTHKTTFHGREGNAEFWTFYMWYRLLYIDGYEHEFIDRKVAQNPLYQYHQHTVGTDGSRVSELADVKATASSLELPGYSSDGLHFGTSEQYDLRFTAEPSGNNPAERYGIRVINERGYVFDFYHDVPSKTLHMAGRETYFDPEPVVTRMPTKHPEKVVWDSYRTVDAYIKADREFRERSAEKAKYEAALAAEKKWKEKDRPKLSEAWRKPLGPAMPVTFEVNVCPGRIQTFVRAAAGGNEIAHIQFYRIGPAAKIECFAEGGEATFHNVQAFESGVGFHWKQFDRPALNQLP